MAVDTRGERRAELKGLERSARERESRVSEGSKGPWKLLPSTTGHVESRGNPGGPPSKAKYPKRPIVDEYREGKVKSTPEGE